MAFSYALYRVDHDIAKVGPTLVLTQKISTIDPVAGVETGVVVNNYTLPGAVEVFESAVPSKDDIDSTVYQVVISAKNAVFTPKTSDVVTFNGTIYRVRKVEPSYIGPSISSWLLYLQV